MQEYQVVLPQARPGQASLKSSDLPTPRLGVLVLILSTHIL